MTELLAWLQETWMPIRGFLDAGGPVLWALLPLTVLLWTLILERFWYLGMRHGRVLQTFREEWLGRSERDSWQARRIRAAMVSEARDLLDRSLPVIKSLIALCPLLGLLGTVTGMIEVFEVMSLRGTGDARGMAGGVSRATLPTMAGMVVALSGLFFANRLTRLADKRTHEFADSLRFH
ncbi:MotA/TolQ/ExbB proton channel family protein [uncultured Abyssibacter sp.]|uniref:MotA/TolQ/ExbB proton channel family protein n=1 Tax=uncultured Abyssibacter sp. TaxID=2320202 RepID=UPI0032B173A5